MFSHLRGGGGSWRTIYRQSVRESKEGFCPGSKLEGVPLDSENFIMGTGTSLAWQEPAPSVKPTL
jgi:hypothetical protein